MSDTTNADPVDSGEPDGATPDDEQLGDGGLKALSSERKARRDAERTARELQVRLDELETAEVRRDVATAKGLTPAQAKRLQGDTREELEADADDILDAFGPKGPPARRPVEDLRGGGDPTAEVVDHSGIADRIIGRPL